MTLTFAKRGTEEKIAAAVYLEAGEEKTEENSECSGDPNDEDPLVTNVEHGEPHVRRQLVHNLHVFLHS